MPFTPFIGISVLVHICIIFGCRLFSWIPNKEKKIRGTTYVDYIINSVIIVSVFMLIFIQADFLVRASITDKHSTVKFIASSVTEIKNNQIPKLFSKIILDTIISKNTKSSDNPVIDILEKNKPNNPYIYKVIPLNNFKKYRFNQN